MTPEEAFEVLQGIAATMTDIFNQLAEIAQAWVDTIFDALNNFAQFLTDRPWRVLFFMEAGYECVAVMQNDLGIVMPVRLAIQRE